MVGTNTSELKPVPKEAADYLAALFEPGDVLLYRHIAKWSEHGRDRSSVRHWWHGRAWAFTPEVWDIYSTRAQVEMAGWHVGVNPRPPAAMSGDRETAGYDLACHVPVVRCLWGDVDDSDPAEAETRREKAGLPPFSLLVATGHGWQPYWLLDEPLPLEAELWPIVGDARDGYVRLGPDGRQEAVDPDELVCEAGRRVQAIVAGIGQAIGGDDVHDLPRLLRLPGTLNRKFQRNGKKPVACRLVECRPERRYPLQDFARFAVELAAKKKPKEAKEPRPKATLDPDVASRLAGLIRACQEAEPGTRSEADFALLAWAAERRMDPEGIWEAVQDVGKFAEAGRRYFDRTWAAAAAKAEAQVEDFADRWGVDPEDIAARWRAEQARRAKEAETVRGYRAEEVKCEGLDPERPKEPETAKAERAYRFRPLTSAEFADAVYRLEWLVRNVLVDKQPAILGGPKKSLKTNLLIDLSISLGTGTAFLGSFPARQARTCLISGESGQHTIQETARRVCKAKGIQLKDAQVWWDFRLPRLSQDDELEELAKGLAEREIEVAIIDPLYLCLLSGGEQNAANIFDMGPLLQRIGQACLDAGAAPILAHHTRKNLQNGWQPLDLEDLAFSGIQEFARQWLLVSRRAAYEPGSGVHQLWLSWGGSAGHNGLRGLDIDEGMLRDDFGGRRWDVQVSEVNDIKAARQDQAKAEKAAKTAAKRADDEAAILALIADVPQTRAALKAATGWRHDRLAPVLARLLDQKLIAATTVQVRIGSGAERPHEAFVRTMRA